MPEPDVNAAINIGVSRQRTTVGRAIFDLDSNPDDAVRAIQLGQATGVPPVVVNSDLENFERQHKAGVVRDILNNNSALRDWAQQNPMASKLANDDWGQLDKVTQSLKPFQIDIAAPTIAAAKGFAEGTAHGLGEAWPSFTEEYEKAPPVLRSLMGWIRLKQDLMGSLLQGASHAIFEGSREAAEQVGVDPAVAKRFGKGMTELAEWKVMDMARQGVVVHDAEAFAYRFNQAVKKAEPWLKKGELPPQGVDPLIDRALVEQAKHDAQTIDEILDHAEKSLVRERSPDQFADLIRQSVGDKQISVPFEAVQKLYGEKLPTPDDGILGWAPEFAERYAEAARVGGGDIEIPLADWIAKVPPEVARELKEVYRPNPKGMNLEEAKALEGQEIPIEPPPPRVAATPISAEEFEKGAPPAKPTKIAPDDPRIVQANKDIVGLADTLKKQYPQLSEQLETLLRNLKAANENLDIEAIIDRMDQTLTFITKNAGATEATRRLERVLDTIIDVQDQPLMDMAQRRASLQAHYKYYQEQLGLLTDPAAPWLKHTTEREMLRSLERPYEPKSTDEMFNYAERLAFEHGAQTLRERQAEVVDLDKSVRQAAGLNEVNSLEPVLLEEGQSEAPLFGKMAIGLTKPLYERFIKAIDRQSEAEKAREFKRASDEIRRQRTKEWREESKAMRPEVTDDVSNRPEWVGYDWFETGILLGVKGDKPKLDPAKLTPAQRKLVPKDWQKKGGSAPDDLASMAGFRTGDELVDVMGRFLLEKGKTPAGEFLKKHVDAEVLRRMEEKHGPLAENILAEAQDHVTGIPQLERLHETTVALGLKAGHEITFTKESMQRAVEAEIGRRTVGSQSRDAYLKESGDAGRKMIKAFLKQDWNEAFRQSQRQYVSNLLAREAGKLQDEVAKFDKLAKKFSKVDDPEGFKGKPSGIYVPYIQQILSKVERPVGRTPKQIEDAIAQGKHGSLQDFMATKHAELKDVELPDFLLDNKVKPVEKLTGEEFKDLNRALKILDKVGREESTVYKGDVKADFEEVRDQMVEQLKALGNVKIKVHKEPGTIKKIWNTYYPKSLTVESILNRWDKDNSMGVFNQYIVRQLADAANYEPRLIRHYQDALRKAVGDIKDIDKMVENTLWLDPYNGQPLDLSKRNVIGMLMYWGNESSRRKLLEGYNVNEQMALKWLTERTTKEDWDRAQNIGHIFKRLIKLADEMSMKINGVPIKKIDITPFDGPYGKHEGWYNPVDYEPLFPGRTPSAIAEQLKEAEDVKLTGRQGLTQTGYYRATTPQTYIKARTEYVAPTAMNLDIIPVRLRQMIHDIAFRPAVLQAAKFFYDPKWQNAVIHHYGKEYKDLFVPFLKDVANFANEGVGPGNTLLEKFRQNLIGTLIGFNPHTVAKHGMTAGFNSINEVGPVNFAREVFGLLRTNEETSNTNWRFAMDTSEELQRRMRNWSNLILQRPEISLHKMGLRESMITLGATPVAASDLFSAVPTWLAQYKKSMREHGNEGQAVFEADRAVRRAHGSSVITNLPEIMRTNALGRTFTSLYGFFSHMLQKQFELAWKGNDAIKGVRAGDWSVAKKQAIPLTWGFVSYVIIPAVVEEIVTPYMSSEKDSWGMKAAKTLTLGLSSSLVGVRDFVHGFINQTEATAGTIGTIFKEAGKLTRDLSKGRGMFDKRQVGKLIRDSFVMAGIATGYVNAQEGKVLQFTQRWLTGVDRPRTPWDWMHGYTTGTLEKRR